MQRALLAGLLASAATAVVGTWVVLRGLTFLGDALAHGVVPGLALAVLWGFSPTVGALAAALVMSGAVTLVSHRTRVRDDTSIGLLFVGMLALGVVIISRSQSFATDVTALLFGDVLGVTTGDLRGQAIAAAVVVTVSVLLYRPFMALTFNADKAATLGMRPVVTHAVLMALLAVSIVASFDAIGTLLVFGLLIGPPATAGRPSPAWRWGSSSWCWPPKRPARRSTAASTASPPDNPQPVMRAEAVSPSSTRIWRSIVAPVSPTPFTLMRSVASSSCVSGSK